MAPNLTTLKSYTPEYLDLLVADAGESNDVKLLRHYLDCGLINPLKFHNIGSPRLEAIYRNLAGAFGRVDESLCRDWMTSLAKHQKQTAQKLLAQLCKNKSHFRVDFPTRASMIKLCVESGADLLTRAHGQTYRAEIDSRVLSLDSPAPLAVMIAAFQPLELGYLFARLSDVLPQGTLTESPIIGTRIKSARAPTSEINLLDFVSALIPEGDVASLVLSMFDLESGKVKSEMGVAACAMVKTNYTNSLAWINKIEDVLVRLVTAGASPAELKKMKIGNDEHANIGHLLSQCFNDDTSANSERRDRAISIIYGENSGFDINAHNGFHDTALHLAVNMHDMRLCRLLVEMGADTAAENRRGLDPAAAAIDADRPEFADFINSCKSRMAVMNLLGKARIDIAPTK